MVTHMLQFEKPGSGYRAVGLEWSGHLDEHSQQFLQNLTQKSERRWFSDFKKSMRSGHLALVFAVAFAFVFGFVSGAAKANFSYNYVQASYAFGEFEFARGDVSYDGVEVTAQFEVFPSIAIGINYLSIEGDDTETSIAGQNTFTYEGDGLETYLLYYSPVAAQIDFLLGARIDMREFVAQLQGSDPALQVQDDTNFLSTGLRYQFNGLELNGQWFYQLDAEDGEDRWSYSLGLVGGNPGQWQLGFSVDSDDAGGLMRAFLRHGF